jgi:hypothetical protein
MNSYQKLKKENAKLKRDIRILIDKPDSYDAMWVKTEYRLDRGMEEVIWFSSPLPLPSMEWNPSPITITNVP